RERPAAQPNVATGAVQFDAAGFENQRGHGLVTELELDAGDQFAHEERLHHVIVGAQFQADNAVGSEARAVRKMMGVADRSGSLRILLQISSPSQSGSMMSNRIRSGRAWRHNSTAPFP